jgi:regulator of cell morphogenesis and NO signaling
METNKLSNATIAEVVTNDYRTALIFKKYGIDFCCGGKKSIARACRDKDINVEDLEKEIEELQNKPAEAEHKFNDWSLSFLADYIVNVHHGYVNSNLSLITEFADKVARVHGEHHPETREVAQLWHSISDELTTHMKKEELILFPYIRKIDSINLGLGAIVPQPAFVAVSNPIRMMEQEHENVGTFMKDIQSITDNFTPPADACNTYRVLYAKLKEFQDDLFQHIHLENNILFPKAIILEEKLRNSDILVA